MSAVTSPRPPASYDTLALNLGMVLVQGCLWQQWESALLLSSPSDCTLRSVSRCCRVSLKKSFYERTSGLSASILVHPNIMSLDRNSLQTARAPLLPHALRAACVTGTSGPPLAIHSPFPFFFSIFHITWQILGTSLGFIRMPHLPLMQRFLLHLQNMHLQIDPAQRGSI